ncbi:hypothetical protein EGW08_002599 [Elysia chlorotica]|uniref:C2H2-type domain-containing protein n=1 Tax=Elysia chlorotica TaxID=188477 RepID=A0A433U7K5_ELYCH|nr:hypothetical protein EGW08_002599 [Elysia chlorotica]
MPVGVSFGNLTGYQCNPCEYPQLPPYPSMSEIGPRHEDQEQRCVSSSLESSASSCPKDCFESTLKFKSNHPKRTSRYMQHVGDSTQECHKTEILNHICVTDTNRLDQIQRPLELYKQTHFQETNSDDSATLKYADEISPANSGSVKQADRASTEWTHEKAYNYKCGICELKLCSNEALLAHINTHTDLMPYNCNFCGVSFIEGRQLMNHVLHSHFVKAPYACGFCNLTFHENSHLQQHVISHELQKDTSNIDVKKHKEKAMPKSMDARGENVELEDSIELEEYNTSNASNPLDLFSTSSNTLLINKETRFDLRKEPSKIVMDDIDLSSVCTVLVEPSSAGGIRKKHLFKCNFCQKICKDKGSLVSHVRIHTQDRPYECNVCCAKFKQYAHLRDHLTKHTKDRPFICDRCAKAFNRKSHLQDHIRLKHTDDKLYHCSECPLTFQRRTEFSEHKRTHVKTLKYQCNICARQFRNITDYKRHARSHTKEKLYECDVCHLTFGLLANAKRHMVKHDKERPFQCDVCPKAYHFEHDLKRHKLTHLKKKPFPCSSCCKSFKTSALLKKHTKTTHMNQSEHFNETSAVKSVKHV